MQAYTIDDPRDEGPLADLTSAGMWSTAGLIGASMFLLPGAPHQHLLVGLLIAAAAIGWGAASLMLWHKRWTMSLSQRAVVTLSGRGPPNPWAERAIRRASGSESLSAFVT